VGRIAGFARTGVSAAVAAAMLLFAGAGSAQQIDPRVLQQVQGSLASQPANPSRQLDSARDGNEVRPRQLDPMTEEELELRRQQSRQQLRTLYEPSPVEQEYRTRLGDPDLRLFGYDLFKSTDSSGSGPLTGAVSDSYVLGVGDELVVSFQGATNDSRTARVDREGRLIVGQLRPVAAAGRTLGAVRSELSAETRRSLLGTEVYVSLGSVRAITVFVGGEVERPGQYQLTSLGDVATALARAGGIRRGGSLRKVRVIRANGATQIVDLYGLLGIGSAPSVRLADGDRIVVPVIGHTVAITGTVARPGIYELSGSLSVAQLITYAGGAVRPRGYRIAVSRIAADGTETFARATGEADQVLAGDAVQIVGGSAGGSVGRVLLRGYVLNRGPRPIAAARTVHELLGDLRDLRFGTYTPMAALVRRDPETGARAFEAVNLLSALRQSPAVELREDDRLYVFSLADIEFMNSAAVRQIILGGPNPRPQCLSLERLRTAVLASQSPRFIAVVRGAFVQRRSGQTTISGVGGALTQGSGTVAIGGGVSGTTSGGSVTGVVGAESAAGRSGGQNVQAAQSVVEGAGARFTDRTDVTPQCAEIFEEAPELLPFLIENSVVVGGAVRQPAAYPISGTITADLLLRLTEGAVEDAAQLTLDVTRYPGTAPVEQVSLAGGTALTDVVLRAGDDIRFSSPQAQYEPGAVLLSGEFARPGLYSIRKGETLSQLMIRAGGLTGQAYPYGAIFTRQRVKEEQAAGLQRTASELNSALLAAITRKSSGAQGGDGFAAAAGLINQLTSVEPVGRVTVEADPSVLTRRQDLDTVLEAGDVVYMPKRPSFVLALGDVNNPGALQFIPGKTARQYLAEAGGPARTADDDRIFLILPDGRAQPIKGSGWSQSAAVIPPGSTLIVPRNIDPLRSLDLIRDVTTIFSQVVSSLATLAILATN